jgi:hypothetical protein
MPSTVGWFEGVKSRETGRCLGCRSRIAFTPVGNAFSNAKLGLLSASNKLATALTLAENFTGTRTFSCMTPASISFAR